MAGVDVSVSVWCEPSSDVGSCRICAKNVRPVWARMLVVRPSELGVLQDVRCTACLPSGFAARLEHYPSDERRPPVVLAGNRDAGFVTIAHTLAASGFWMGVPKSDHAHEFVDSRLAGTLNACTKGKTSLDSDDMTREMRRRQKAIIQERGGPYLWGLAHPDLVWTMSSWMTVSHSRVIITEWRDQDRWVKEAPLNGTSLNASPEHRHAMANLFDERRRFLRVYVEDMKENPRRVFGELADFLGIPSIRPVGFAVARC